MGILPETVFLKARLLFLFLLLLVAHISILGPFNAAVSTRPVEIKLGYMPHPQVLKLISADHDLLVAEVAVVRVLFYFGTIVEKLKENVIVKPEHFNMFRTIFTASQIDPYNNDVYYFAQAAFTWELGRIDEVNELLEHGMKYRVWDPWLPFYLGFNHAYFLKNYEVGAKYLQKAAEVSGNPLFANLAARYYYEAKQTQIGLTFLDAMIMQAKDPAVRSTYQMRRLALLAVMNIEQALDRYLQREGRKARTLDELIVADILDSIPVDPYGGEFYLDETGRVRSTSKFARPVQ